MPKISQFINLGDEVKDKVTGYIGTAISRIEHLNGCVQYLVKARVKKDNKVEDGHWIDEAQLERTGKTIVVKQQNTGGPLAAREYPKL